MKDFTFFATNFCICFFVFTSGYTAVEESVRGPLDPRFPISIGNLKFFQCLLINTQKKKNAFSNKTNVLL